MTEFDDAAYMSMAYGLAEKALGRVSPNPCVGALIVKGDAILGTGYHEGAGKPHAETVALDACRSRARGATLYVTLEPCVHWGHTPPCVDSVLSAGLSRVVISALDSNPLVHKKGAARIRESGIKVAVGILEERNKRLNEFYIKYITRKLPFVTLKAAVSLDGKIATKRFDSRWISSAPAREYIHLLRGEYDGLMVGINTILRDNPLLTIRHPNWPGKKITRIVLDAGLRLPFGARILSTQTRGEILVFAAESAPKSKRMALEKAGVEVIPLPGSAEKLNLGQVLSRLSEKALTSLLVEGGGHVLTSFLEAGLADKILLTISPRLIGGEAGPSVFGGEGVEALKDALRLRTTSSFRIDEDLIVEGYF